MTRKCRSFIKIDDLHFPSSVFIGCLGKSGHIEDHHYVGVTDDKVPKPLRIEWHTFTRRESKGKRE